MLNVTSTLAHLNIPLTSATRAVQAIREKLGDTDVCKKASNLIKDILSIDTTFDDADKARVTAMAVAEALAKCNGIVGDEAELYAAAVHRAEEHMNAPRNRWMYVKAEAVEQATETKAIEGTDLKVAVKADGKIKRGGKQQIAEALFKKHVVESETPCDNACFVQILMKEAGMSLAGARTYAHNCRKAAGMTNK